MASRGAERPLIAVQPGLRLLGKRGEQRSAGTGLGLLSVWVSFSRGCKASSNLILSDFK